MSTQASKSSLSLSDVGSMIGTLASDLLTNNKRDYSSEYSASQLEELWCPSLTGATEKLVETCLGSINIIVGGKADGPALVLWPSVMMKGSMFSYQYEHFRHTHRVVLIDSPGINKSEGLRKLIDLRDCKDALLNILDHLGIEKCIFGGNSWGAMMAAVLPAWIPERLIGTIVINGTVAVPSMLETIMMTARAELLMMCEHVPAWWMSIISPAFAGDSAEAKNHNFMAYIGGVSREDPKSIAWAIKGILLGRKDYHHLVQTIQETPVLVLAGEEDRQFSITDSKKMADSIPTSKFVTLPGSAHLASRENPELVNREIDAFLQEIGSG